MTEETKLLADFIYTIKDEIHAYRLAHEAEFLKFVEEESARMKTAVIMEKSVKKRKSKKIAS